KWARGTAPTEGRGRYRRDVGTSPHPVDAGGGASRATRYSSAEVMMMATTSTDIRFTDRDLRLIKAALPDDVLPRKLELLDRILREWGSPTCVSISIDRHSTGDGARSGRFDALRSNCRNP